APNQDVIAKSVTLEVRIDGQRAGAIAVPPPSGRMIEVELSLPAARATRIEIAASGPYRAFHWFVLQPE
ncbi:MAG: hypothetical protein AB7T06_41925, partial [Kofleriaceae bacterium]